MCKIASTAAAAMRRVPEAFDLSYPGGSAGECVRLAIARGREGAETRCDAGILADMGARRLAALDERCARSERRLFRLLSMVAGNVADAREEAAAAALLVESADTPRESVEALERILGRKRTGERSLTRLLGIYAEKWCATARLAARVSVAMELGGAHREGGTGGRWTATDCGGHFRSDGEHVMTGRVFADDQFGQLRCGAHLVLRTAARPDGTAIILKDELVMRAAWTDLFDDVSGWIAGCADMIAAVPEGAEALSCAM